MWYLCILPLFFLGGSGKRSEGAGLFGVTLGGGFGISKSVGTAFHFNFFFSKSVNCESWKNHTHSLAYSDGLMKNSAGISERLDDKTIQNITYIKRVSG